MVVKRDGRHFDAMLGSPATIAKQRRFGEELKQVLRGHDIDEGEAKPLIDAAMDYMTSYAADAYERGLQEGAALGYEAGREEAHASMATAGDAHCRRILQ